MKRDPGNVANAIMLKSTVLPAETRFYVVEGLDDPKMYGPHLKSAHFTVAHGKPQTIAVVAALNERRFNRHVGLIDGDFDALLHVPIQLRNLARTCPDNDIELTAYRLGGLSRLLAELGDPARLSEFENQRKVSVVRYVFDQSALLGKLRLLSHSHGLGLTFDGLDWLDFVDSKQWKIEPTRMCAALLRHQRKPGLILPSPAELMKATTVQYDFMSDETWRFCRGHDVSAFLSVGLAGAVGSLSAEARSVARIESSLRLAFGDFSSAPVAADLKRIAS